MPIVNPRQLELLARVCSRDTVETRLGGARKLQKLLIQPAYRRAFERGARARERSTLGGIDRSVALISMTLTPDEHRELVRLSNPFAVQRRP